MSAYSHKRTAHRGRLLALMLAGLFCAFGSFWLVQIMDGGDSVHAEASRRNEPDYIVDNFSFVRMSETGQPRYVISGAKLIHRPVGDVSDVDLPVVQSMSSEHPRMTMHARRGRIRQADNEVDLMGSVDVARPASPTTQALRIRTEALTLVPDDDIIKTDQAIEMQLGATLMRGTGMVANNAKQQLHMASRGQIIYPPRTNR